MKELDRVIQKRGKRTPRVLLHACCGPCSSAVLEYLAQYFDVTVLWYNPNIYPQAEFDLRFKTLVSLIEKMGLADRVSVLAEPRKSEAYYSRIKGLENGSRGRPALRGMLPAAAHGMRAPREILRLRLFLQYPHPLPPQGRGPHQHSRRGDRPRRRRELAPSDFKKRDGENRSIELCEQYGVYRQLYCGCEFSLHHREETAAAMQEAQHEEE